MQKSCHSTKVVKLSAQAGGECCQIPNHRRWTTISYIYNILLVTKAGKRALCALVRKIDRADVRMHRVGPILMIINYHFLFTTDTPFYKNFTYSKKKILISRITFVQISRLFQPTNNIDSPTLGATRFFDHYPPIDPVCMLLSALSFLFGKT